MGNLQNPQSPPCVFQYEIMGPTTWKPPFGDEDPLSPHVDIIGRLKLHVWDMACSFRSHFRVENSSPMFKCRTSLFPGWKSPVHPIWQGFKLIPTSNIKYTRICSCWGVKNEGIWYTHTHTYTCVCVCFTVSIHYLFVSVCMYVCNVM